MAEQETRPTVWDPFRALERFEPWSPFRDLASSTSPFARPVELRDEGPGEAA